MLHSPTVCLASHNSFLNHRPASTMFESTVQTSNRYHPPEFTKLAAGQGWKQVYWPH